MPQEKSNAPFKPQKSNFLTGLITGIAVISTIGFIVLLAEGFSKQAPQKNNDTVNTQPAAVPAEDKKTEKINVSIKDTDHIRGSQTAPITLLEFSDFQCPFCKRFHPTMQKILKEFNGQVRWVYRNFPLSNLHQNAQKAAEAAECAGEQNKFWEYADKLFENSQADGKGLHAEDLQKYAQELNLDVNQFNECLSTNKTADKVKADMDSGRAAGISGTPGTIIIDQQGNTQTISGALPYNQVKEKIEAFLK